MIQGSGATAGAKATLDMEALDTFIAYVNQIRVAAETGSSSSSPQWNRPNGTLILAKTNVIAASGSPGLVLSRTSSNGGAGVFRLGQTNAILSNGGMIVGDRKATTATRLDFNPNVLSPTALFRNLAGTGRQNQWAIGDDVAQTSTATGANGTVDFTGGTVDALANTILVGRGGGGTGTGVGTGTLTLEAGVVDVNTLDVGILVSGAGVGTVNVNGTGLLVVNNALRLTPNGGAASQGTLNINGGTAQINSMTNGGGLTADINMTSGTLVLTNEAGTASAPILNFTAGDSAILLPVDPARTNIFVSNLTLTSFTNNTISILSLPAITSYPAQYPLVSYLSYFPFGPSEFMLGSTPPASPAYQGYISNNVATSTIDLVITGGPPPVRAITWNGNVNGDWNTSTANWLFNASSTTYNQNDLVLFNDSATRTTVNLTTSLTPGSLTVSNNTKGYTFNGSGTLDGAVGLVKEGSGQLTLANSGVNAFAGPVSIEGGTLQISGSANRLPTNAAVTLADVAGAVLDLNGLNQTIATLSGGGLSGGNVSLGSGELAISAGGGSYAGIVSGSGRLVKTSAGTQELSGANLYAGGTVVTGGRLNVANATGSGAGSGAIQIETNATFAFGNGGAGGNVAVPMITNNGTVVFDRSDDFTCNIPITGNGRLTKANSSSIVTLPISNTYTGGTTVVAGGLRISNAGALGTTDGRTAIQNEASARLELTGGITLLEPLYVSQKQSAAGYAPCILNVSGDNTVAGDIELTSGGSYWIFHSEAGKLIVSGAVTNTTTSNTRTLWLGGPSDGEWNTGLRDGAGGNPAAIRKDGAGTWTLAGTYTHTGITLVSNGTLLVSGTISAGNVTVDGGTLGGNGAISVPVTVNSGGTLSPGTSIGKLSIFNSLTLNAGSTNVMELSKSGMVVTNDEVSVLTTLTLGGTLDLTLSGTVSGGEVFQLFTVGAPPIQGAFDVINLPPLPGTLAWDTSKLNVNGTLSVVGGTQPTLGFSQSGNVLTFSWSEAGFKLQAQTNAAGIGTNWFYYPGGEASPVNVTINPANPSVFFRLAQ